MSAEQKITAGHLSRDAYLYIRQSTIRQVFENTESTERQYALRQRAVALGWPSERVIVIDCDQGHSGASTADREGFQKLVADVGLGKAGIVMGLEVSRLARNSIDWHRLLEICALTGTLILDEDGLYDPAHFNDRLLLGLKGTMSEAELHVLRARLHGGIMSKAGRGELKTPIPVGLVYNQDNRVVLDPDKQVQGTIRLFFETYRRTGSAWATVQTFRRDGVKFPRRWMAGSGDLLWDELTHSKALDTLHNPRYAGAFVFCRTRRSKGVDGSLRYAVLPRDQWRFLIKESHEGYIGWNEFEENQRRLQKNARTMGVAHDESAPREGSALIQGMVICGKCGKRMTIRYHQRMERLTPDYVCQRDGIENGHKICQSIPGGGVDDAIGKLLIDSVTPLALEVALNVQEELQARIKDVDRLRRQQVERAAYEAEQARVRYMRVDPNNRLVADSLEADWNNKLRGLNDVREECEKQCEKDRMTLTDEQKTKVLALAADFPKLWNNPQTSAKDRKRMAQLILEDVTLVRDTRISVQARFRGGATKSFTLPMPLQAWQLRKTRPEIVTEIDRLLDHHTEREIVDKLNERGWRSPTNFAFNLRMVERLRRSRRLATRGERLRARGLRSSEEIAGMIGVADLSAVNYWRRMGMLKGIRHNAREYLYDVPDKDTIELIKGRHRSKMTASLGACQ